MSYNNFGRGRGYGPQATRGARRFGRPRFPRPPFRHAVPPRSGRPTPFGTPWQSNNMFFQPHPLRGNPQFRADGRRRRFHDMRFPAPNRLPVPSNYEEVPEIAVSNLQVETDQNETVPQFPLLGSEEERQQKITETADRLKQKLSSFTNDDVTDIWYEDAVLDEDYVENRCAPVVTYKSSELNLTYTDLKDIGKINPDNTKPDDIQDATNVFNVVNNIDTDVILDENENGSHLVISSNQVTNLENVPDDNKYEDNWDIDEPIDNFCNLEQSNLYENNNTENELLESNFQEQCDTSNVDTFSNNILQDNQQQDDQQQNILQTIDEYPINDTNEKQDENVETFNLQAAAYPIDSVDLDLLQKEEGDKSQIAEKSLTNTKVEESVLNIHTENSNSNSALTQPALVNNIELDNQLPTVKEISFNSDPPTLSPHIEPELPVDFDPTTPPPTLLKQDQPHVLPSYSVPSELPPLFDPTAPPPNINCLLGPQISCENVHPAWNNAQHLMPAVYNNMEVQTGLNTHGRFMLQQLPSNIPNQNNVFLPPSVESVNFSPMFPVPSNSHSGISTHVPAILPPMHVAPPNTFIVTPSLPEVSSSSDVLCNENKDDGLDDMQEAMKFAEEMTNLGKTNKVWEPRSNTKFLSERNKLINPVSNVESIALPPGKPKVKINKQKRTKENVMNSKKKIIAREQSASKHPSSEVIIQDANVKNKEVLLTNEHDRPKVVFNLNNKMRIVNSTTTWQENNEKKNGMTQFIESEKLHATPSVVKKNLENILRRNKEKEKNLKRKSNSENIKLSESIAHQCVTLSRKRLQKDVRLKESECSNISLNSKIEVRKPINQEKIENIDTSWKNKIISRFLKMSKNDIFNMVNNTSLRKFDIKMNRLVKEEKPTLSLEMRHAQDEKMKLYDQQEFMKQLSAMLDTGVSVSTKDLPTEFIHHLNEVLQLDVQLDNPAEEEDAVASSSQYSYSPNKNYLLDSATQMTEFASGTTTSNDVNPKCVKSKSHATKAAARNKNVQIHNTKTSDLSLKDSINVTDDLNISSKLLTLQHDLDNIFSEVTKKIQTPVAGKQRKRYNIEQQNANKFYVGAISRNMEKEAFLEDDSVYRLENCARWDEKCDRWKRKEREDLDAYRNLTKEEWEAKHGIQSNAQLHSQPLSQSYLLPPLPALSFSTKKTITSNKNLSSRREYENKIYPRRRHSSESSRQPSSTRHRSLEKDKHKKSRRHSDDRRHSTEYVEHEINYDSSSNSSDSSSDSSSSSTSNTDSSENTNVTKLLRVIKENEKVAKQVSLNEAIRDEVNAEIERERRSRKVLKNSKNRKQKKVRHKKKRKQNKKMTSSSDTSEGETTDRLLTESEIKKEIVENQVMQQTIVKEEVDIGQENIEDSVSANVSSVGVENNVTTHLLSQNSLESPLTQEIPLVTINPAQLHTEDRLPTSSPTQLKTKAQLKQMPETSDLNDNKVLAGAFTYIPEDWNTIHAANLLESTEDANKSCQKSVDIDCGQDKTISTTIDDCVNKKNNNTEADKSKSTSLQQVDATVSSFNELSRTQDDKELSTDNEISGESTVTTLASTVSGVSSANTLTQKSEASKKIDIKTYYERAIKRRIHEKSEPKKSTKNPAKSTLENSITPKTVEPEVAPSKPCYSGPIQDPRLASARLAVNLSSTTINKDSIVQATSDKNVRQKEKRVVKEPVIAGLASKRPADKDSNHIVDGDSVIKKINRDKPKDKTLPAADNASADVTTSKIATSKSKKHSKIKENAADKTLQSKAPSDPKRFKNIRSEGGKELKLKKEMAKEQKAKKKPASNPSTLISTKVYFPVEKATTTEEEKKIDNTSNISKVEIERPQLTCRKDKVNDSNTKMESSIISSGNADNVNALRQDKTKECSSNVSNDIVEREKIVNINKTTLSTHQHSNTKMIRNKEDKESRESKRVKKIGNVALVNKKSAKKISNISDVSATSKAASKNKTLSDVKKIKENSSACDTQRSNAKKDAGLSLNNIADQSQIKRPPNQESLENVLTNRDTCVPDVTSSSKSISVDKQSKENARAINNTKENNTLLNVSNTCKSANVNRDKSQSAKSAKPSSSNENSREQGAGSSDSLGSPFKGFLQETVDFEQSNLFDLKLNQVGASKKKTFLGEHNVTRGANCSNDTKIEERQNYETLESGTDYANDTSINVNEQFGIGIDINIGFGDPLLVSDKECAKGDSVTTDVSTEQRARKSSCEITTLNDDDINIGEGGETDGRLMSKESYASCAGLVIKESMLINEEDDGGPKDLASKLKTTTDPSLSDALEKTILDDVPENQIDSHMYLETSESAEKVTSPGGKLPDFDSDEQLDNMFYLDDPLQDTTAFDNKDEFEPEPEPEQDQEQEQFFSDHPRSPRYDADLSKPEECNFDLKHMPDSDLLARMPIDTPRTLNVPTKAALKEPVTTTNLFFKPPSNVPTVAKETPRNDINLNYQATMRRADERNNIKTLAETRGNGNPSTQGFINVNMISTTRSSVETAQKNLPEDVASFSDINERPLGEVQRNPVVELLKMKELDKLLEKRQQGTAEKIERKNHEGEKQYNGTTLHKVKKKKQMKHQPRYMNKLSLVKRLKKMKRTGKLADTGKEAILKRMQEIDLQMHKLSTEKLKLHELLYSNISLIEKPETNSSSIIPKPTENITAVQSEVLTTLTQITQSNKVSYTKQAHSSKSSFKERKRNVSYDFDNEVTNYLHQKTKMPVIKWKKKPRLELMFRREETEAEDDFDEATEHETPVNKKPEDGMIATSQDLQKPDFNTVVEYESQEEKITEKSVKEIDCNVDQIHEICLDKNITEKNLDDQDLVETERAKKFDIDKQIDVLPPNETPKVISQPTNSHLHSTPERLAIYSDDSRSSTWGSLVQNTVSEVHENRKITSLALLDEALKKELKQKAIVRKKKLQLNNILKTVNNLTKEEETLPLGKLYIMKLQQQRDLLDSLDLVSQKKEDANLASDSNAMKNNVNEVINAVAENRVDDFREPRSEARVSDNVLPTSSSTVLQSDSHQFYVDAEANANSDWPCREKEHVEEITTQQNSNDEPGTDGSNHVFKAVNQDKVPFYDEHNEKSNSIERKSKETLLQSYSSNSNHDDSKDSNISHNFDIKVSVPKNLIKDFNLGLLQKSKDTEPGVVDTGIVDSTTNISSTNSEILEKTKEMKENLQNISQIKESVVEEKKMDNEQQYVVDVSEKEETNDSASDAPSAAHSSTVKSNHVTEDEESSDNVTPNDEIITSDPKHTPNVLDSTEKIDLKEESDIEAEHLSNVVITLKQDRQSMENTVVKEKEKSTSENKSRSFEKILNDDQSTSNTFSADLVNERLEESNEASVEHKTCRESILTSSSCSVSKAASKDGETNKKLRRKLDNSAPVRRSTRNSYENVKHNTIKETDTNSSELQPDVLHDHEKNFTRSRSKSPVCATHNEKTTNNGRKNRTKVIKCTTKKFNSRKICAKSRRKIKEPIKHLDIIAESEVSENNTVVIGKKRKHMECQLKNCKVKIVDCKPILHKYVNREILDNLGIFILNPASSDSSCMQHTTSDQNIISATTSGKNLFSLNEPYDKTIPKIEVLEENSIEETSEKNLTEKSVLQVTEISEEESTKMQYTVHKGPILDIKIFENSFLAASEDSKIYRYSQTSNGILNIYHGHKSAVTCLYIYKTDVSGINKDLMYSGSLDGTLRCYNIVNGELIKFPAQVNSPIQCMDQAWGIIFIGTKSGHVSRFHIKTGVIKGNSIPFSDKSVLALKATNEGPRRILIVASRNKPITIRDAQNGLFLRTISGQKNPTVYSLLRHDNLIYCGTSSTSINVFDFSTGEQIVQYDAGVGIVCMRLYKQLLFAGCYNGNIYVFDINTHKLVCSIQGPGNMLLSIEVVNNQIIAGSKDKRLHSWQMPTQVRALL